MNLKTPGREDDDEETKLYGRADVDAKTGRNTSIGSSSGADTAGGPSGDTVLAASVVKGLGGLANITDVDNCITRLRTEVKDSSLVDEKLLKSTGAAGVMTSGKGVQVIYGPRVTVVANAVRAFMENPVDVDLSGAAPAAVEAAPGAVATAVAVATIVRAPLDGTVIPLAEVEDPVFAGGMVGPGVGIRPTSNTVVSPVDGEVVLVFPTGHAIGLKSDTGVELLIHIGLDTVKLEGKGFETLVTAGDIVEVGTPLVTFDPEVIEAAGYKLTTPVLVTNAAALPGELQIVAADEVKAGNGLFVV